jgi:hypothetical protein
MALSKLFFLSSDISTCRKMEEESRLIAGLSSFSFNPQPPPPPPPPLLNDPMEIEEDMIELQTGMSGFLLLLHPSLPSSSKFPPISSFLHQFAPFFHLLLPSDTTLMLTTPENQTFLPSFVCF